MKEKKPFFKRALGGMLSVIIGVAMIPLSSITAAADSMPINGGADLDSAVEIQEGDTQLNTTDAGMWYYFTASSTANYTIESTSSVDPECYLYSSGGSEIANADDDNGTDFVLNSALTEGDIYYLKLRNYDGVTEEITLSITHDTVPSSTITPTTLNFSKSSTDDVEVVMELNGNSFDGILNDDDDYLLEGVDYEVSGNNVTIFNDYLQDCETGLNTLTFDFDAGTDPTLKITVTDPSAPDVAQVKIGSVTSSFTSFAEAFNFAQAVSDTATIKLLANVTYIPTHAILVNLSKTITLDFNGKNITADIGEDELIHVDGTLNLTDSSTGTAGTLENTTDIGACIDNSGTINMERITMRCDYYGIYVRAGSSLKIISGTIQGGEFALYDGVNGTAWTGYTLGADSEYVTNTPTLITVKSNSETVDDSPKHNDDNDSEPVSDGASGWSGIQDNIDDADSGDEIDVNMNGSHTLPSSVLSAIKGKDIDLVIDMGDYTWTINGKDVTTAKDIDLRVLRNRANLISQTLISNLVGTRSYEQVELRYDGEFGFTGTLTINMTKSNAGKYANLYYHNPATGKLEYQTSGKIGTDGKVDLDFSHASDYVLVLDDKAMTDELSAGAPMTDTSTPIRAENTLPYIAACIVLTSGMIVYMQKRKAK